MASDAGWQPLSTAPKGKRVLLYHPPMVGRHGQVTNGAWINIDVCPPPYPREATLWAPIPDLPADLTSPAKESQPSRKTKRSPHDE